MQEPTQTERFLALTTSLGEDVLVIEKITGTESLGSLYDYRIVASATNDQFDIDDIVGTKAHVKMENAAMEGPEHRYISGIISQVDHVGFDSHGRSLYELSLVPWLWLLTRTSDCRIFQSLTVPEIIKKVFGDLPGADFQMDLKAQYPEREYCVQYRETDFNFVQRLMEHEGIYYFWEHKEGAHTMVVCDHMSSHKPVEGFGKVRYRPEKYGLQEEFRLSTWQAQHRVTPGKYAINSFDFKSPKPSANTKLLSRSDKKHPFAEGEHEVYDNPGDYVDRSDGERLAGIRREELQCRTRTITTRTDARGLFSGCLFKADEIPRKDQNGEYVVISTWLLASAGNYGSAMGTGEEIYECEITAIPSSGVYRPDRSSRRPKVDGPQTAIVSGPSGEEIHVDNFGRVKVQFLWDREGKFDAGSSCWIRVSQAWAGGSFGSMAIPRIGHEVIVSFLEGDPDRPIITGRVYNGGNMPHASNAGQDGKPGNTPPANLPGAAAMTSFKSNSLGGSGGHNEITMNDTGGKETLFFKAQKDEIHTVGNNREDSVAVNETRTVGANRNRTVGANETVDVGVSRTVTVGASHTETVGATQTVTVGASQTVSVGAAQSTTVGGAYSLTVSGAMAIAAGGNHTVNARADSVVTAGGIHKVGAPVIQLLGGQKLEIVVGGSSILMTPGSIDIKCAGPITITGAVVKVNG